MAQRLYQFPHPISAIAVSGDCSSIAVCPNSSDVYIYRNGATSWQKEAELLAHEQLVAALDWAPSSGLLVSCSYDRNAFVWQKLASGWERQLVIARLARAALCVAWCRNETKFAIGSGAKGVCVCQYDNENKWWACKHIKKKHSSSVLSVAWHPSSLLLATGSSDMKCRLFTAHLPGEDASRLNDSWCSTTGFGELLAEFEVAGGWVHDVAWAPAGDWLMACDHNSAVAFCKLNFDAGKATPTCEKRQLLQMSGPPLKRILAIHDNLLVAGGWSGTLQVFNKEPAGGKNNWSHCVSMGLERVCEPLETPGVVAQKVNSFKQQVGILRSQPRDTTQGSGDLLEPLPVHTNCIVGLHQLQRIVATGSCLYQFCSAGVDGRLVLWAVPADPQMSDASGIVSTR